jgi:glycosyltransferase involved in cell wall biosynthesis
MRIGIDARQLCGPQTGVGRYLSGLIHEWATSREPEVTSHEFILYVPAPLEQATAPDARRFVTRLVPGSSGTWWEQMRLPRAAARDHLDVFFAPQYSAPLTMRTPTVVAIHDVSFAAHPEWFRWREGMRLRWLSRRAAANARAIVTISEFSRRELGARYGVRDDRIRVIPPGIPERHLKAGRSRAPRLLFVGSIFNRRHVVDLIRAFAEVARVHPDATFDLAGDNRSYPHEDVNAAIDREGLGGRIRWHRYASEAQLAELYGQARAFAFLSEYEGLGLTPLEALAAGAPPVLLDTPVARESCGEAALYVELGGVAKALERLLFDDQTRTQLLSAAPPVLAKYSWPRAARETLAVLKQSAQR